MKGTRNPVRLVLDPSLRTDPRSQIYDTNPARTIVATLQSRGADGFAKRGVEVWTMPGRKGSIDLDVLLRRLVKAGLLHMLVEGQGFIGLSSRRGWSMSWCSLSLRSCSGTVGSPGPARSAWRIPRRRFSSRRSTRCASARSSWSLRARSRLERRLVRRRPGTLRSPRARGRDAKDDV